ncbi:hypothetical protein ACTWQB_14440 [Piscibacillus sp. B03]|uniref:hypothetical protein n=1 Tax=Piscibacillus sp. B03 TaxID=3457430 RepID=UPI003FCDE698
MEIFTSADYFEAINKKRQKMLLDLVKFRAVTTDQFRKRYFDGKGNSVNNVLGELRKKGYIKTSLLKGTREGRKGHPYHRITKHGLKILLDHGYEVDEDVENLYLRPQQLKYVLTANDIMMELEPFGWTTLDSRGVKKKYNMDRRSNILGELQAPDGRTFGFYVLEQNADVRTIGRIQGEIKEYQNVINDFIIFAKGESSYDKFLFYGQENEVATGYNIKLISLKVGLELLSQFPFEKEYITWLSECFNFKYKDQLEESERQSFKTLIEFEGEEMYLVDMTYSDLSVARSINNYNISGYRWEKRRLLVPYILDKSFNLIEKSAQSIVVPRKMSS